MALSRFKTAYPIYKDIPASYAGRLDPMAAGKLLVLLGEECKKQERYTSLDKEYVIEVLLGVGSDTGDALGIVEQGAVMRSVDDARIRTVLKKEVGAHQRAYPAYSSKTVNGKPLFLHALLGTLGDITIPEHEERIYSCSLMASEEVPVGVLEKRIEAFLSKAPTSDEPSKMLGADFRIDAVRASWKKVFLEPAAPQYFILRLRIACASGTYMRSLAGRIGASLGTNALALSITRTKIGRLWGGLWLRSF